MAVVKAKPKSTTLTNKQTVTGGAKVKKTKTRTRIVVEPVENGYIFTVEEGDFDNFKDITSRQFVMVSSDAAVTAFESLLLDNRKS